MSMLQIVIPAVESYDSVNNLFITSKEQTLQLEHSLVSLSKWESKWHKPFLGPDKKTDDEVIDYIRCMTTTQNVDDSVYKNITGDLANTIIDYINDSMTATWFSEPQTKGKPQSKEIITSELIYYWMIALNIPVEFQKWHLNRLMTLIKVCNIKNEPPKKMSKKELLSKNRAMNEARRKAANSKG